MKHHIALKFVALLLCSCFLLAALASGAAVICIAEAGLYSSSVGTLRAEQNYWVLRGLASDLAQQYAAVGLGGLSKRQAEAYWPLDLPQRLTGSWCYTIQSQDGNTLLSSGIKPDGATEYEYWVEATYPVILRKTAVDETGSSADSAVEETQPGYGTEYYGIQHMEYLDEDGKTYYTVLGLCRGPSYQVKLFLAPDALGESEEWIWMLAELGYQYRYTVIAVLLGAVLLFAVMLTYLCCAAGRKPGSDTVCPGGLNRLPLDLYGVAVCLCGFGALIIGEEVVRWGISEEIFVPAAVFVGAMGGALCLLVVGFLFAFAAQVKTKGGFWWRKSLAGRMLLLCWRLVRWLLRKIGAVFGMLPLIWQWLLVAVGMGAMVLFAVAVHSGALLMFSLAVCAAIVIYGAYCFGKLYEGVRRMSRGELGNKVSSAGMVGCFRRFALDLNALADVAVDAAKRQMTSERMKAELVTNVSHDIKTPLTSVINYVDLLQKAETEEQRQQYLEVLSRQSQRMKKLLEDLLEMSKASSGAMPCELRKVDAVEAVNQALGEFADKLEQVGLVPVVQYPKMPITMLADGRLTWRVLSNLLSNAVKYAMPGTRLYIDVMRSEGRVMICLKNVSREPLKAGGAELMERFVRGDASRNTEGSGLGLNIARSLMELQHGQLQVFVDGDLFKAMLILPEAK